MIYLADDAARAERLEKVRRRLTIESAQQRQVPRDWDPLRPWSCVFLQLSQDMEYWADRVHHPAAAWTATGGRGLPVVASEAAVLEVIQGGQKALGAEAEHATSHADPRRTQSNRDKHGQKTQDGSRPRGAGETSFFIGKWLQGQPNP